MKTTNIRAFSEQLLEKLKKELDTVFAETGDMFGRYSRSLYTVKSHITQLREFTYQYQFSSTVEEMDFFKNVKPILLAQYYYYESLASYTANKPTGDREAVKVYSHSFLGEIRKYNNEHLDFFSYCVSGASHLDHIYFTRNSTMLGEAELDIRFSTKYDLILARFVCNQHLEESIYQRIQPLEAAPEVSPLKWTTKKAHLVELIYALHKAEAFNNGKAELKEIANIFESLFNVTLGNLYRQFQEISLRKVNRTIFMDELKEKLEKRFDEFNE